MAGTSVRSNASSPRPAMTVACSRRKEDGGNSVIDVPTSPLVMPGLVPGIHVLGPATKEVDGRDVGAKHHSSCPALCRASTSLLAAPKHVDGRDKPGHDEPRPGRREISNSQSRHTPARSRGAVRPSVASTTLYREGAGNAGCALHPRSRVQK